MSQGGRRKRNVDEPEPPEISPIGISVVNELARITGQNGNRFIVHSVFTAANDPSVAPGVEVDILPRQELDGEFEMHTTDVVVQIASSRARRYSAHMTIVTQQITGLEDVEGQRIEVHNVNDKTDSSLYVWITIGFFFSLCLCCYAVTVTIRFRKYIMSELMHCLRNVHSPEDEKKWPSTMAVEYRSDGLDEVDDFQVTDVDDFQITDLEMAETRATRDLLDADEDNFE